jgi:dTDP-4-amino-4,6-dideoxygalactose transaminase
MRILRNHGAETKYRHTYVGGNFRLDTLQAAILLVKLRYLDEWNEARRERAAQYRTLMENMIGSSSLCCCPTELPRRRHVYNQFVVRSSQRDRIASELKQRSIATAIYYPEPLHIQECFRGLGYSKGDFPESERAALESLALPMFPELTAEQQQLVVSAIACTIGERRVSARR